MNHTAVATALQLMEPDPARRATIFADVLIMESAALEEMAKK